MVVGCGRSGTTLLRTMLGSHPDMAVSVGLFPLELWRVRERYEHEGGFDLDRFAQDLLEIRQFRDQWVEGDLLRSRLSGVQPIDYPEAWRRVFAIYAGSKGKSRYGHKSPGFVLHLETLAGVWPEARFVHIHRDGRDVALSLVEQGWGPTNVAGAARWWARHVRAGRRSAPVLGDRYIEVRYEELVAEPETVLRRICGFVELEFDPEMLRYQDRAMTEIPERFQVRHTHLTEAPKKAIRDWRRDMPGKDVAVFEAVAGRDLQMLGYERRFPRVPVGARVEARTQLARSTVRMRMKGSPAVRKVYRAIRRGKPGRAPSRAAP